MNESQVKTMDVKQRRQGEVKTVEHAVEQPAPQDKKHERHWLDPIADLGNK